MFVRRLVTPAISVLPIGLREAADQLMVELAYRKRHLLGTYKARKYRGRTGLAMHLGCGNQIKDGWVNIDLNPAADLTLDARERLPFADNTFSIVYSEHFYGCFSYPSGITSLLSECYRVLEFGGIHSFSVPDGEKVLRHYTTHEYAGFDEAHRACHPSWCRTQMDHVVCSLRDNGAYRWYYDEETMRLLLASVGFVEIQRRSFDPKLDQESRRVGSMFMQCMKAKAGATVSKGHALAAGAH